MERAKQQQQQQQPSQSSGQSTAAPAAPASKPLPVNGTGGAASKDGTTNNKDIKLPHRSVHDNSTYYKLHCVHEKTAPLSMSKNLQN